MRAIGIDPGTTGALAIIDTNSGYAAVHDLPTYHVSSMRQVDPDTLIEMIEGLMPIDAAFIEDVHANALSYKSNFALGHALGCCITALSANNVSIRRLKPKDWQRVTGLASIPKTERKDAHRARAMEIYPELRSSLKNKQDHNRADAVLIADAGIVETKRRNSVTP